MSLTKKGKTILKNFEERYGKSKGKTIFYAKMVKNPKQTIKWHIKTK